MFLKSLLIAAAALLVVVAVLLIARERIWAAAFGPADQGPVTEFARIERPDTPNTFLMCPPEMCGQAQPDEISPVFRVPEQALRDAIIDKWSAMARTRLVAGTANGTDEIRFVQYSRFLGFPDTISVHTGKQGENRSTLSIYSRSQVGRSDLGANRDRVEKWLKSVSSLPQD